MARKFLLRCWSELAAGRVRPTGGPDWRLTKLSSCRRSLKKTIRALFRCARAGEFRRQSIKEEVDDWRSIKCQHLTNEQTADDGDAEWSA
jgi:hypothetical protein